MAFNLFGHTKTISPIEANRNMKQDHSIMLIDVREAYEYKSGYIKGARNVPLSQIPAQIDSLKIPKQTTLYIYCQSGARSERACGILNKMGYEKIYNLGGIINWPYEIINH
jgi:rhodanese-related sulfurtransferase